MTLMELEAASGVGASTISKIERGVSRPQAITLHKLADALGVEVGELYPKEGAERPLGQTPPETKAERRHEYLREELRARGVEVNNSEAILLAGYLEVHENPPKGIYSVGYVVKEDEPVDHGRVLMLLAVVLGFDVLTEEETEAAIETLRQQLAVARS